MKIAGKDVKAKEIVKWIIALVLFVIIAVFWGLPIAAAFGLFALGFLLDVDPVIAFAIALTVLGIAALMVLLAQKEAAKILSMWSYCFLAVGVVLQLYHYILAGADKGEDNDE